MYMIYTYTLEKKPIYMHLHKIRGTSGHYVTPTHCLWCGIGGLPYPKCNLIQLSCIFRATTHMFSWQVVTEVRCTLYRLEDGRLRFPSALALDFGCHGSVCVRDPLGGQRTHPIWVPTGFSHASRHRGAGELRQKELRSSAFGWDSTLWGKPRIDCAWSIQKVLYTFKCFTPMFRSQNLQGSYQNLTISRRLGKCNTTKLPHGTSWVPWVVLWRCCWMVHLVERNMWYHPRVVSIYGLTQTCLL